MNSAASGFLTLDPSPTEPIQEHTEGVVDDLLASLPRAERLSAEERRGIIARYTAVLEGNFIYWMTAAYLSVRSEEARSIILENLREEVRDCHPGMLRKFTMAAHAVPKDSDALAVYRNLEIAQRQGSVEREYTDVHGVCDVAHTQELFRALEAEMPLADEPVANLFEGVDLLKTLIQNIIANPTELRATVN